MKNRSRLFRVIGAAALLVSMLAATVAPAAAQQTEPFDYDEYVSSIFTTAPRSFVAGDNTIYYPWVSNGEDFGLGPSATTVSIQNLEDIDGQIWIFRGDGNNTWTLATTAYLSAYASKTFSAAQLGIAEGSGAPVAVIGYNVFATAATVSLVETTVILSNPVADDTEDDENDGGDTTQVLACVVNQWANALLGSPAPFVAAEAFVWDGTGYAQGDLVEWATQADLQEILNDANEGNLGELINPFGGLNQDGDCLDAVGAVGGAGVGFDSLVLGGTALQTATVAGPDDDGDAELEQISTTHTSVSGYNALNGIEVYQFDEWYLPIVQTNCGPGGCWDSMLRVANVGNLNSAVTVRFFPADDGSGSLQTGFQLQGMVDGGDTWHINLGDYVPEGWVGTAHILTDGNVFAMVDRYKVGYNMWITNTGSSANYENLAQNWSDAAGGKYALFAPHVLMDYYGWNTGINVANLAGEDNNVSIQYFNMLGNATQVLNQRLAAHGMTYFYDPSVAAQDNNSQDVTTDPNAGVVGSAIIWSDFPVAAAVDATKYPETDPNGGADVGHATSYSATQNVFTWQAVPYVTKGNPIDGSGATSGINIMNPNPTAATANVYWVNPSGFNAQNFGVGSVSIPGFANGFVYTLWQHNLPNGFQGAAQVISNVPVAAVSANVNYDVEGDGSAIFNAFNPCGLYRTTGGCSFGDPFDVTGGSVTKYFVDEAGDPVPGVTMQIDGDNPAFPYTRQGVSNVDGQVTMTNVPVGTYDLNVLDVPAGYVAPENPADVFTIIEGEDIVIENMLMWDQGFTKFVCIPGEFDEEGYEDAIDEWEETGEGSMPQAIDFYPCTDVGLADINVIVYENIGEDYMGGQVSGDIVFEGVTDEDGMVAGNLPSGDYILCIYDEDASGIADDPAWVSTVTTSNGEEVDVFIQDDVYATAYCEQELLGGLLTIELFGDLFTVEPGEVTALENPVFLANGIINMFVWEQGDTAVITTQQATGEQVAVEGVEVCVSYYDYWNDWNEECAVSNSDGELKFIVETEGMGGIFAEDASLEGFGGGYGFYEAYVYSDDYCMVNAEGGELTAEVVYVDSGCGERFTSTSLQSHAAWAGNFEFYYDATADVAQDGYLDDDGVGTNDVEIEVEDDVILEP